MESLVKELDQFRAKTNQKMSRLFMLTLVGGFGLLIDILLIISLSGEGRNITAGVIIAVLLFSIVIGAIVYVDGYSSEIAALSELEPFAKAYRTHQSFVTKMPQKDSELIETRSRYSSLTKRAEIYKAKYETRANDELHPFPSQREEASALLNYIDDALRQIQKELSFIDGASHSSEEPQITTEPTQSLSQAQVESRDAKDIKPERPQNMVLTFGGEAIKYEAATHHFCFVGATGSGKTIMIRLLMESILGAAKKDNVPTRMLIYDSKRDMMPVLYGIFERLKRDDAKKKITLLNPFDTRGVAWDLADDINEPAHAQELASLIVPEESNAKDPFFPNAARLVIESVVLSFIEESPGAWTFRDVCNAITTRERIESVLLRSKRTSWVIGALFGEPKTTANILATLAAALRPYRIIAALWHNSVKKDGRVKKEKMEKISLHHWLASKDGILVLGNTQTSRTAIDAINQLLFRRLSQIILEEQGEIDLQTDPSRVWVILDEFVRAGRLNGAVELATEGRSKGVSLVLGFQDINGLKAVYGKEVAEEIIGQCTSLALLRMNSPETSDWASRIVGHYRGIDISIQQNQGDTIGKESSHSRNETSQGQVVDRPALLPSHFQRLKPISKEKGHGLSGVFCSPYYISGNDEIHDRSEHSIGYDWLFSKGNLWPKSSAEEAGGFDRRDACDQYLEDWDARDYDRLKLTSGSEEPIHKDKAIPQGVFTALNEETKRTINTDSPLSTALAREMLSKYGITVTE
jgi:type IV secretory pathway TraG/TraD family ATPase VirD4